MTGDGLEDDMTMGSGVQRWAEARSGRVLGEAIPERAGDSGWLEFCNGTSREGSYGAGVNTGIIGLGILLICNGSSVRPSRLKDGITGSLGSTGLMSIDGGAIGFVRSVGAQAEYSCPDVKLAINAPN